MRHVAASGRHSIRAIVAMVCLGAISMASYAQVSAALGAVAELGKLNGVALACRESAVAAQARSLMLERAPKTDRYGSAYHDATQAGFASITQRGESCPEGIVLTGRFEAVAARVRDALPGIVPATSPAEAR